MVGQTPIGEVLGVLEGAPAEGQPSRYIAGARPGKRSERVRERGSTEQERKPVFPTGATSKDLLQEKLGDPRIIGSPFWSSVASPKNGDSNTNLSEKFKKVYVESLVEGLPCCTCLLIGSFSFG